MKISIENFFAKNSHEFYEFRALILNAKKYKKNIQLKLDGSSIEINLVEHTSAMLLVGRNRSPYMSSKNGEVQNLFAPFTMYYTEIVLPSTLIYMYPKYSWSIANFFAKNVAFIFLVKSHQIILENSALVLPKAAISISKNLMKNIYAEYRKSMLGLYVDRNEKDFAYYNILNSQFVLGDIFKVQLLDYESKFLAMENLQQYEAKRTPMIVDNLLKIRSEYQQIKFKK